MHIVVPLIRGTLMNILCPARFIADGLPSYRYVFVGTATYVRTSRFMVRRSELDLP